MSSRTLLHLPRLRVGDQPLSQVTNTPGAVDDATATTAVYLIISAMRQFARAEIACRNSEPLRRFHLMALRCGSS